MLQKKIFKIIIVLLYILKEINKSLSYTHLYQKYIYNEYYLLKTD